MTPPAADTVFARPLGHIDDFIFDETVAAVFDDMVSRSVPMYAEIQRMLAELALAFVSEGSTVYDLGCSTGTTLTLLHKALRVPARLVGIDNSEEMLQQCRTKLAGMGLAGAIELECGDLDSGLKLRDASVVFLVLTLMFVRPLNRERLMRQIYAGMREGGCLLLVEKVLGNGSLFNRL
jgi:tRNA (cmo5U34)-methyltransferase